MLAFEDEELTVEEKIYVMVKNLYVDEIPEELFIEASEKAKRFIDCDGKFSNSKATNVKMYSFTKDADYIFTGINSTHHVDIEEKNNLHWYKFMDFFMDMSPDCFFGELMYYRKRKAENKLTKEEKKQYKEIKDLVDIESVSTQSSERKEFFEKFHKAKNREVINWQ